MNRLRVIHDVAETALLVAVLIAMAVVILRDGENPLDVVMRHAGVRA